MLLCSHWDPEVEPVLHCVSQKRSAHLCLTHTVRGVFVCLSQPTQGASKGQLKWYEKPKSKGSQPAASLIWGHPEAVWADPRPVKWARIQCEWRKVRAHGRRVRPTPSVRLTRCALAARCPSCGPPWRCPPGRRCPPPWRCAWWWLPPTSFWHSQCVQSVWWRQFFDAPNYCYRHFSPTRGRFGHMIRSSCLI